MIIIVCICFCLVLGFMVGDLPTIIVSIGVGTLIGLFIQICWNDAKRKMTPDGIKKHNQKVKKQDDYDNYWGIIDFHDK